MKAHSGYAKINGANLYYETTGQGEPVVFVHGFSLDNRMWDDQFHTFAPHYQVIRYDARGFGKSDLPTAESYSHHADLKALLEHLGVTKAHLIGLSMGGRVATDFAIAYPEMTASVVLVDSVLHGYVNKSFTVTDIGEVAAKDGWVAANDLWLASALFAPAMSKGDVAKKLVEITENYSGWHWVNKNPWTPLDQPTIKLLPEIKARTLVIIGEHDLPDFQEIADILVSSIPNAKKVVIPGAGHMCNMEAPEVFNEVTLGFLRDTEITS